MILDPLSNFACLHAYRLTNASQSQARIQKRGAANTFRHRYVEDIKNHRCIFAVTLNLHQLLQTIKQTYPTKWI
jgi:hypothetical protein